MPSQLQISSKNACLLSPWSIGVSLVCSIWENGMRGQWTWYLCNYSGAQGFLTPTTQGVAAPPIFMSPRSSGLPQARTQNKHLFVTCASPDTRKHVACVSRCFHTISLSSTTTHTKKYPLHGETKHESKTSPFPFPWIPGHNFWF